MAAAVPLILCLVATWATVHALVLDARSDGHREFTFAGDEIQAKIEGRLAECAQRREHGSDQAEAGEQGELAEAAVHEHPLPAGNGSRRQQIMHFPPVLENVRAAAAARAAHPRRL